MFSQSDNEILCETWDRYKALLCKYPNHEFDLAIHIHMIFRNGLLKQTKLLIDATPMGSFISKITKDESLSLKECHSMTIKVRYIKNKENQVEMITKMCIKSYFNKRVFWQKSVIDIGDSKNLKQLCVIEMRGTKITLQMAEKFVKCPNGMS